MKRGFSWAGSSLAAIAIVLASSGPVAAEETSSDKSGPFCATMVGEAPPSGNSPVLAEACSEVSPEDAATKMRAEYAEQTGGAESVATMADLPLMHWYEHGNFNRDLAGAMTTIYGSAGTCDTAGYRVEPAAWWQDNLSSIFGDGSCAYADITNRALNYTKRNVHVHYDYNPGLGSFDNNVGIVNIHA
ncbi:hypothetical protein GCM10027563_37520 [Parasphingorhabdus pacifica]